MSAPPPLCIGLPVRNGARYLEATLAAILGQGWGDFELVAVDNASDDATPDLLRDAAVRDPRVRLVRNRADIGAHRNFNRAFSFCRSPFFAWAVHDDLMEPGYLAACMALLRDAEVVLAHARVRMIDCEGRDLAVREDGMILAADGTPLLFGEAPRLAEDALPSARFADVLRRMSWYTALNGIIRSEALGRTRLVGAYYGADQVMLAELALLGRYRQTEAVLYAKRVHDGISLHLSGRQRQRWAATGRFTPFPGLERRLGFFRAALAAELPRAEKLACLMAAARVAMRNPLLYRLLPRGVRSLPLPSVGRDAAE